jgi:hypothetical protein
MTGSTRKSHRIAIVWRGGAEARGAATPQSNRFYRIFEELAAVGIHAEPAVYDEGFAYEIREQLLAADGVLVWVDPIHQGKTRSALDPLLRDVAGHGPWVSAHPDVILKMGVKEVLSRTRHLGWGADTQLYRTPAEFRAAFPPRLRSSGPRVLKQNRGNGGQGVWKGPDSPEAQPGPRIMHGADAEPFQALRRKMEDEWVPQMMEVLRVDRTQLPIIWDADFLYGPRTASGEDTYVLCEINVSSCFAIPDEAAADIARLVLNRCRAAETAAE